jgi:hypothetical protein
LFESGNVGVYGYTGNKIKILDDKA